MEIIAPFYQQKIFDGVLNREIEKNFATSIIFLK
jgi:hypothetical protein